MSVPLLCEKCGQELGSHDHPAGDDGPCEHCGHGQSVPAHTEAVADAPLQLRPIEAGDPSGGHGHLLDPHSPLFIRAASDEPHVKPEVITGPDDSSSLAASSYTITDSGPKRHSSAGPPPFWVNAPSLFARSLARRLRTVRDWIYLVSVAALVLALLGFLFKTKGVLHVGVVLAIAANIGMFVIGMAYLVTLPFKEGLRYGLANLLVPFYAVYYWYTRWPSMRAAVWKTFGSFLPIFLATVAFVAYEDGSKIVEFGKQEIPIIEEKIENGVNKLEVGPVKRIEGKIESAVDTGQDQSKGRSK